MTSKPTLDQRRARHAWRAVERAGKMGNAREYGAETKKLPVRIRTSGLGQAVAFLQAKAKGNSDDPRSVLLADLKDWLISERRLGVAGPDGLIHLIKDGDSRLLRRLTEEALLYLQWLSRFCEAEIGDVEDTAETGG